MIGLRTGPKTGIRPGLAVGIGADGVAVGGLPGVTRDATSLKYAPSTAAEWTTTLAFAGITSGGPMSTWTFQAASGTIPDAIGTTTLSVLGGPLYQQSVTGWARKAASTVGAGDGFYNNTDVNLPDPTVQSVLAIGYVIVNSAPAGDSGIILADDLRSLITATDRHKANNATNAATGTVPTVGAVRPWVVRHNLTATTTASFTDLEKISPTYAAPPGNQRVFFGDALENAPDASFLWGALFKGAAAELSDAQLRTLLQTLGWTISW